MKKIYSTIAMVAAFSFTAFAQQQTSVQPSSNKTITNSRGVNAAEVGKHSNPSVQTTQSFWVNYGTAVDSLTWGGGLAELNQNYLCTDSALLGTFGTEYAGVWINEIGDILDPYAPTLEGYYNYNWNSFSNYTVDSMSIMYAYSRNTPANIVDTLVVYLYYNTTTTIMPTYYFTGMTANFGSDTVYFKAMPYSYTTNSPSASNKIRINVPLTDADTAETFFRMKDFAANYPVPGGKLVASAFTFKPGYAYVAGDTIDNFNSFFFASTEEQGAGTYPTYNYCPNTASAACDWNVSQIVTSDVRYNNEPSWNGFFIPSYAYTAPYGYEHHQIWYKITSLNVGVAENLPTELALGQNVPNPSTGNTMISYSIPAAGNVAFNISDVTGKLVMSSTPGHLNAGTYQVEFNTANLQSGVYFYTLTVDGQQITRKLIVQ